MDTIQKMLQRINDGDCKPESWNILALWNTLQLTAEAISELENRVRQLERANEALADLTTGSP